MHSIVFLAGQRIAHLLKDHLSTDLLFHNFQHTSNVVRGVREICKHTNISKEEEEVLLLAAWFHDSGLTTCYKGHEEESQKLAEIFLKEINYPSKKLTQVLSCIAATHMPQAPNNLLEQIICDADLFHLSLPTFCHTQVLLLGRNGNGFFIKNVLM